MQVTRFSFGCFLLLFAAISVVAQTSDRHLAADSAHPLYARSAYAHGYIHGYEDGFHGGDMDIHMGRGERPLNTIKEFKESNTGYQSQFGDKQFFKSGYKQGFREGYSDAVSGGQFRAVDGVKKCSTGIAPSSTVGMSQKEFDRAFSAGYDLGHGSGTSDDPPNFEHAANLCQSQLPRSESGRQGEYCDAFMRGFSLGYGDSQASRIKRRTQTAKK